MKKHSKQPKKKNTKKISQKVILRRCKQHALTIVDALEDINSYLREAKAIAKGLNEKENRSKQVVTWFDFVMLTKRLNLSLLRFNTYLLHIQHEFETWGF